MPSDLYSSFLKKINLTAVLLSAAIFSFPADPAMCASGTQSAQEAESSENIVCGCFYDLRYGDLLLGRHLLTLAPKASLYCNGIMCSAEELTKKAVKSYACAHLDGDGMVIELHCSPSGYEHYPAWNGKILENGPVGKASARQPVFFRYECPENTEISVRLRLDGRLVESGQVKLPGLLYYEPEIPFTEGVHEAEALVVGKNGTSTVCRWNFETAAE